MSSGRTYAVILFFWALLTVVTPMLIRLSASANLYTRLDGDERKWEGVKLSFPRRALVAAAIVSPAPTPAPAGISGSVNLYSGDQTVKLELHGEEQIWN